MEGKWKMRFKIAAAFILMFVVTIYSGFYSYSIGENEILHFWLAVPAGNVTQPMVLRGAGPPISLSPITIDLNERGLPKNLLQPNVEAFSTHWIYNLGTKPVRIRMELENCDIPVEWEVNCNFPYDPETHTFTGLLMPGSSIPNLGIDWVFHIPTDMSGCVWENGAQIVYRGALKLVNADTGEVLTYIPVIVGKGVDALGGADCCG